MKEEELIEQTEISIVPFSSEIIGANTKYVFIKEQDQEENWYVLKVKRSDFNKMIKLWLDRKAEYCTSYNHFCGVFGGFFIKMTKDLGEINLLVDFDDETPIYKNVPLLLVILFDKHCDMEHG